MTVETYIRTAHQGIMNGLIQELQLVPGLHYRPDGYNSARVATFSLKAINPHYLRPISQMQDSLTMWAGLDKENPVRITYQNYSIVIEIPKPQELWKKVSLEGLERNRLIRRGAIATIGLRLDDKPVRLDFTRPDYAHTFITGQTRSGKTNTQKLVAWNLADHFPDGQLIIFDVAKRGYKWSDFANVASLAHPIVTDLREADRVLTWAFQELDRRAEKFKGVPTENIPKTFLLIDELKALIDDSKVAALYLNRLASMGGEFGLHLILSAQYPQSSILGAGSAEMKRNVTTRLCGKVDDATAAVNALGIAGSGAESLQGYGDFLLKDGDGLSRLAVTLIEPRHIEALPRVESVEPLQLPDDNEVDNGAPRQASTPDPLEPDQVALALFRPMGINRLAKELSVGNTKAGRIREFAQGITDWATSKGYRTGQKQGWTEFDYYDPIPHL